MKTILVAGGAGFIGSHLCEELLKLGHRVFAIDNLLTGKRENIEHLFQNPKFSWIEQDVRVPVYMNVPCDQIYNLASPASPVDFEKMPVTILQTGSKGHQNLLDWARANKARILLASTSEVYGDPLVHPQTEDYFGNVNSFGPRSCYDESKRYAEALSLAHKMEFGVEIRIARIFNTYGPRMRPEDGRVIPNFFSQALKGQPLTIYGTGNQTRSLCYVSDQVQGLISLMESSVDTPVNIGNPAEIKIIDLAKTISEVCGQKFQHEFKPLPKNDPQQRRPDITKAKSLLKWEPAIDLHEGLKRTLAFFKSRS
ncbi:MAG: SDR family oxidoreductase [Oligoflexia bacterium]|nr:SDR family oxidoreductase [Oligoflexia bacterium]